MSTQSPEVETKPISDSVPKINGELAVGADLEFQKRWWKFERAVWWCFAVLVFLAVLGCFGRGPVAKAELHAADKSLDLKYERIERLGTPSLLTIDFGPDAIRDGKVELLASESLVQELGAERIVPQPQVSRIGDGNILYTFPASHHPATVQLGLAPTRPGYADLTLQVPGFAEQQARIYIMP